MESREVDRRRSVSRLSRSASCLSRPDLQNSKPWKNRVVFKRKFKSVSPVFLSLESPLVNQFGGKTYTNHGSSFAEAAACPLAVSFRAWPSTFPASNREPRKPPFIGMYYGVTNASFVGISYVSIIEHLCRVMRQRGQDQIGWNRRLVGKIPEIWRDPNHRPPMPSEPSTCRRVKHLQQCKATQKEKVVIGRHHPLVTDA